MGTTESVYRGQMTDTLHARIAEFAQKRRALVGDPTGQDFYGREIEAIERVLRERAAGPLARCRAIRAALRELDITEMEGVLMQASDSLDERLRVEIEVLAGILGDDDFRREVGVSKGWFGLGAA